MHHLWLLKGADRIEDYDLYRSMITLIFIHARPQVIIETIEMSLARMKCYFRTDSFLFLKDVELYITLISASMKFISHLKTIKAINLLTATLIPSRKSHF